MQINRYINGEKKAEFSGLTVSNEAVKEAIEAAARRAQSGEERA